MSSIAIVTDSDSSLPSSLAARYGIRQVPICVHFGHETYRTGIDIDDAQLFERVDREGKLPTTSAPSPGAFEEVFREVFDQGAESVVCICVSSKVSATYAAAVSASEMFPGRAITIVDSQTLSLGQGIMAVTAARAAQEGAAVEEVVQRATEVGARSHIYAALSTVKYLAMSGRVGKLAAGMATLLNVKPILTVRDGNLDLLERVRTQKKAWARLLELAANALQGSPAEQMYIVHANAAQDAARFEQLVREQLPVPEDMFVAELSAGLSVHTGAGVVGLGVIARG
jgi:DegV family protein with EDD domain